ncbi:MAG: hypothetical protein ACHQUB_03420 [Candidatus Saccharimonadia bacterium]
MMESDTIARTLRRYTPIDARDLDSLCEQALRGLAARILADPVHLSIGPPEPVKDLLRSSQLSQIRLGLSAFQRYEYDPSGVVESFELDPEDFRRKLASRS